MWVPSIALSVNITKTAMGAKDTILAGGGGIGIGSVTHRKGVRTPRSCSAGSSSPSKNRSA